MSGAQGVAAVERDMIVQWTQEPDALYSHGRVNAGNAAQH